MDDHFSLQAQINLCRRLARYVSDPELHRELQVLAAQYEARLPKQPGGFMLRAAR